MLNIPGGISALSVATMVNATAKPLSVPVPVIVTVCATSSKVTEVSWVDWKLTPEFKSLKVAVVLMEIERRLTTVLTGHVIISVRLPAHRRLRRLWPRVVAANAVDLERNIVCLRLRVCCGTGLVRRREAVAAHFLEQARGGGVSDVCRVHVDRERARVAGRRHAGATNAAVFSRAAQARLRVGDHVWKASRHRAKIHALSCACVEHRPVQQSVFHGAVVDGVAHLPTRNVLEKRGAGYLCRSRGRIGKINDFGCQR